MLPLKECSSQETSSCKSSSVGDLNVSLSVVDVFVVFDYIVKMFCFRKLEISHNNTEILVQISDLLSFIGLLRQ